MNFIARAIHRGREVYISRTNNTWHLAERNASAHWFESTTEAINTLADNKGFDVPAEKWRLLDNSKNAAVINIPAWSKLRKPDKTYSRKPMPEKVKEAKEPKPVKPKK